MEDRTDELSLRLNRLAQGMRPPTEGIDWFEQLPDAAQLDVLRRLAECCFQARAQAEDGPESIRRAGIRPTHTPAVLITRGRLVVRLPKIIGLPPDERTKSFRLLVALPGVADDRRREVDCAGACGHPWHRPGGPA